MSHTPGPWRVDDSTGDLVVLAEGGKVIAYFGDMEVVEGTDLRDATLIAAAPDMLAALKALVTGVPCGMRPFEFTREWLAAEDAVAKAEGRDSPRPA